MSDDKHHIRTYRLVSLDSCRFRGMISTQAGSTPLASFNILSIDSTLPPELSPATYWAGNNFGPYGEKDEHQL